MFYSKNRSPYYRDWSNRALCGWLICAHGMGLVGGGKCAGFGIWWHQSCPCFITDDEFMSKWKNEYAPSNQLHLTAEKRSK